jgi:hypothetical protein
MLRRLLNIASVVCLVACVALMGMWVRSCFRCDFVRGGLVSSYTVAISSIEGRFVLEEWSANPSELRSGFSRWSMSSSQDCADRQSSIPEGLLTPIGFTWRRSWSSLILVLPYYFLVLITGSLSMLLRMPWPLHFTLRSLFIATTFLAIVLGMSAWLDSMWIGK